MDSGVRVCDQRRMKLGDRLRELRLAKGVTVARLAKMAGISVVYLHHLESGKKTNPSAALLQRLATALGSTVPDLLGQEATISGEATKALPASFREFLRKSGRRLGLRQEDIEVLRQIHFRGRRPTKLEEWELIYLTLKTLLG